jgi:hypothetical protein
LLLLAALAGAMMVGCANTGSPQANSSTPAASLVFGPYVNSTTQSSAKIVWAGASDKAVVTVQDFSGVNASAPQVVQAMQAITGRTQEKLHIATVTGLRPATNYAYHVATSTQTADGVFQTVPPLDSKGPLKFVTYSDPQTYPERHARVVAAVMKELPFAFLAVGGDYCDDDNWAGFQREFFTPARDLLRQVALWTVRGNHEADGLLYHDLFAQPGNGYYYSFDYGNLHYVVLDQYEIGAAGYKDPAERAKMLAWVDRDLAAAKAHADWLIVSYHEPTINVAGHGSDWGRKDFLPVLEKHGVDIVLSGHSHVYERFRPIGPKGAKPIIHITSASAGGMSYVRADSPILDVADPGLHYCVFTINGNHLDMVAKTPDGQVADWLSLTKTDGKFQKEIMDRSMTMDEVAPLVKVFKQQHFTIDRLPEAGKPLAGLVGGKTLPAGYQVTVAAAPGSPWKVEPLAFLADGKPVAFQTVPPEGTKLSATPWSGAFVPELRLKITIAKGAFTSTCDTVETEVPAACLRQIVPVPAAVSVPRASAKITVAGRLDDWQAVPPLELPSTGEPSRTLRLAWKDDGLYGLLRVKTDKITVDAENPWQGDSLELGFEMDGQRRLAISPKEPKAATLFLSPVAGSTGGRPAVLVQAGALEARNLDARWEKTTDGYLLEFRIPAKALAPARFVSGGTLGFNFVVHGGAGQEVEQFVDGRRFQTVRSTPVFWGKLKFAGP